MSPYSIILVHAGTNDLNNLITSGQLASTSIRHFIYRYIALRANIRRCNSHALILISSVLPRLDEFQIYDPLIRGINFALEKMCAKTGGACLYVPSFKWFMSYDSPIKAYFASDGIHPNGAGNGALQAGFQQSLSVGTMIERAVSRRTKRLAALP